LGGLGQLFKNPARLYVYPILNLDTGAILTAENFPIPPRLKHLYTHLMENRFVQDIHTYDASLLPIRSNDLLAQIQSGDARWEKLVPAAVVEIIKRGRLFGYRDA